ncbi:tetratricopeptide repeat protein [Chryseobacterium sp. c4a]|uniref:tetratricopeptide repeat protein n=1 Tax=Chryseobacterium sp. c4a TaxID=1573582 RepID=UPI00135B1172|nr:tetratricopeptide repeat protein [Chryseobacterium sp. c4a]
MMNKLFFIFTILSIMQVRYICGVKDSPPPSTKDVVYVDNTGEVPYGHQFLNEKQLEGYATEQRYGYYETKDLDFLTNRGYILIVLGRYNEAIEQFRAIDSIQPGRYSTYSNMGTAFEMAGNTTEALQWIEKALKTDPKGHLSSEWIHINILKAHIKGDRYISSMNLIGKDFGNEESPKSNLTPDELKILRTQLYYQLNERMSLIKPKDKVIAQLLFDLGNITFLEGKKKDAMEEYQLAKDYGFDDPILIKRLHLYPSDLSKVDEKTAILAPDTKEFRGMIIGLSLASLLMSGLILFIFRKKVALVLK